MPEQWITVFWHESRPVMIGPIFEYEEDAEEMVEAFKRVHFEKQFLGVMRVYADNEGPDD